VSTRGAVRVVQVVHVVRPAAGLNHRDVTLPLLVRVRR
jgi:hypothetical protein